jgi:hypothetical protein
VPCGQSLNLALRPTQITLRAGLFGVNLRQILRKSFLSMKQMKFALLAPLAMAVLLSACDQVNQGITDVAEAVRKNADVKSIPIQFLPNSYVLMDGKRTRIQGFDDCVKEPRGILMEMMFGPDNGPDDGCIVVKPDSVSVEVMYFPDGRPIPETWTVEYKDSVYRLRRPNGEFVVDAGVAE